MLQLRQKMGLHQRMTPQQVQYLKLLQTPAAELESKIKEELDENPLLEEVTDEEQTQQSDQTDQNEIVTAIAASPEQAATEAGTTVASEEPERNDYTLEDFMNDETEGFKAPRIRQSDDDEDREDRFQQASVESFTESLLSQL